jgi:hypothetical protein
MKIMITKADKPLRKIRSLTKVQSFLNKRQMKAKFMKWIDQTNFLISLCERVE